MTARDKRALWEKIDRYARTTSTYVRSAEEYLYAASTIGVPAPSSYWNLLDVSLDLATAIIKKLPDDFFEDTEVESFFGLDGGRVNLSDDAAGRVEKLAAALLDRRAHSKTLRRIEMLENVEGRTPEEAAAYRDKAERMRAELAE